MKKLVLLVVILVAFPTISLSDIYKWKDEDGIIHFSDSPNSLPENSERIIEDKKTQTWSVVKPNPSPTFVVPNKQQVREPGYKLKPYSPPAEQLKKPMKPSNTAFNSAKAFFQGTLIYPIIIIFSVALFVQYLLRQQTNKHMKRRYLEHRQHKDTSNNEPETNNYGNDIIVDLDKEMDLPYSKKKYIQSRAENNFAEILNHLLKDKYEILPQIQLSKIVGVDKKRVNSAGDRYRYHNKIDRKSVDYVVCDKQSKETLLVIELDDSSHNRTDRIERDAFVDEVLQIAGFPILHIKTQYDYDEHTIKHALSQYLEIDH